MMIFLSFMKASEAAKAITRAVFALIPSCCFYLFAKDIDAYGCASKAECRAKFGGLSVFAYCARGVFPKQWGEFVLEFFAGLHDDIFDWLRACWNYIWAGCKEAYNSSFFAAGWGGGVNRGTPAERRGFLGLFCCLIAMLSSLFAFVKQWMIMH